MDTNHSDLDLNVQIDLHSESKSSEKKQPSSKKESPLATIHLFHMIFKLAPIGLYLLGGIIFSSVSLFILVAVLASMDFWFTKNVVGRLLVGLKWDYVFQDDGKQVWIFESKDEKSKGSHTSTFWLLLVIQLFRLAAPCFGASFLHLTCSKSVSSTFV